MPVMYCRVNLFSLNQDIAIVDTDGKVSKIPGVTIENIADAIPSLCEEHNINSVKLYGITDYVNGLAETIAIKAKGQYSNNNLYIEVNPE